MPEANTKKCREEREDEERALKIAETLATKAAAAKHAIKLKKEQRAALKIRAGVATDAIQHQISLMVSNGQETDYLEACNRATSAAKFEHERYCISIARKNFEEQLIANKKNAEAKPDDDLEKVEPDTSGSSTPTRSPYSSDAT